MLLPVFVSNTDKYKILLETLFLRRTVREKSSNLTLYYPSGRIRRVIKKNIFHFRLLNIYRMQNNISYISMAEDLLFLVACKLVLKNAIGLDQCFP
jgi:hypothetical protein